MEEMDVEVSLKVIVVGNGMVGKTSLITRFATGRMTAGYKKTIGTDFMEKEMTVAGSGETVRLMLWDTAGQEMFSRLTRSYYKGSGAVVFVFSTTDRDSFEELPRWQAKVREEVGDIVSVLVQNKVDLMHEAQVTAAEAEEMARSLGLRLYRCCVKDNVLVEDVFHDLCQRYLDRGGGGSAWSGDSATQISELTVKEGDTQAARSPLSRTAEEGADGAAAPRTDFDSAAVRGEGSGAGGTDRRAESGQAADGEGGDGGSEAAECSEATGVEKRRRRFQRGDERVSGAFQLTPLTVRTKGKKTSAIQQLCTIL